MAIGLRLLAHNLDISSERRARPDPIRELLASRAAQVVGLGAFRPNQQTIVVTPFGAADGHVFPLPWVDCHVRYAA